MLIGRNIKQLRKQQGITQETPADFIGSAQKQISKMEAGKARPNLSTYLQIANVFQVSIDWLLVGVIESDIRFCESLASTTPI